MGHIPGDVDIAAVASALADTGRSKMLLALGDGRALAASTLAMEAGVAPSTASVHLAKLVDADLLRVECHGRHRYYRMAGPEVGELLEPWPSWHQPLRYVPCEREPGPTPCARPGPAMTTWPASSERPGGRPAGSRHPGRRRRQLRPRLQRAGPTLGGRLGDCDYRLTDAGRGWMDDFGVSLAAEGRRPLVRYCVDWSEQRHHLAGALGAALLIRLADLGWLRRSPTSRAVQVTDDGRRGLAGTLGVEVD